MFKSTTNRHQAALNALFKHKRVARGPAKDTREAIDTLLAHIETHKESLFGHAIRLPESAGGGVRLVSRTNYLSENGFGAFKHGERVRTGYKNLGHVLETLPAEALLARNLYPKRLQVVGISMRYECREQGAKVQEYLWYFKT